MCASLPKPCKSSIATPSVLHSSRCSSAPLAPFTRRSLGCIRPSYNEERVGYVGVVSAPANVIESLDRGIDTALDDLAALARIPSVSAPGFDPAHVARCAQATAELLAKSGLERVEVLTLPGAHPYAVG